MEYPAPETCNVLLGDMHRPQSREAKTNVSMLSRLYCTLIIAAAPECGSLFYFNLLEMFIKMTGKETRIAARALHQRKPETRRRRLLRHVVIRQNLRDSINRLG